MRLLLSLVLLTAAVSAQTTALIVGKAHLGNGEVIENATILVAKGMIVGIGTGLEIPEGATVIRMPDGEAMPGMVDGISHAPLPRGDGENEESSEITPSVRIARLVDTSLPECERLMRLGVTTLAVHPGSRNVIGGIACAVKTGGAPGESRVFRDELGLVVTLGLDAARGNGGARGNPGLMTRLPNSRMGVVYLARRAFEAASAGRDARRAGTVTTPPTPDEKVLLDALAGRLPVFWDARESKDAEAALRIAAEFGVPKNVLFDCMEAHLLTDKLKAGNIPVLLGRQGVDRGLTANFKINGAAELWRGEVDLGFSHGSSAPGETLRDYALYACRAGFGARSAVRALTLEPARILGIADRVGSLEEGKDADICVLSGPVLSPASGVRLVMINGLVVHREMEAGS